MQDGRVAGRGKGIHGQVDCTIEVKVGADPQDTESPIHLLS